MQNEPTTEVIAQCEEQLDWKRRRLSLIESHALHALYAAASDFIEVSIIAAEIDALELAHAKALAVALNIDPAHHLTPFSTKGAAMIRLREEFQKIFSESFTLDQFVSWLAEPAKEQIIQ